MLLKYFISLLLVILFLPLDFILRPHYHRLLVFKENKIHTNLICVACTVGGYVCKSICDIEIKDLNYLLQSTKKQTVGDSLQSQRIKVCKTNQQFKLNYYRMNLWPYSSGRVRVQSFISLILFNAHGHGSHHRERLIREVVGII